MYTVYYYCMWNMILAICMTTNLIQVWLDLTWLVLTRVFCTWFKIGHSQNHRFIRCFWNSGNIYKLMRSAHISNTKVIFRCRLFFVIRPDILSSTKTSLLEEINISNNCDTVLCQQLCFGPMITPTQTNRNTITWHHKNITNAVLSKNDKSYLV